MHILVLILMFVFGSIAACKGDWSGMAAIGNVILWIVTVALVCFLVLHPVLLVILGVVGLIVFLAVLNND